MKKIILYFSTVFFLFSCGGDTTQKEKEMATEPNVSKEEIVKIESQANEIEVRADEIESAFSELDSLVENL